MGGGEGVHVEGKVTEVLEKSVVMSSQMAKIAEVIEAEIVRKSKEGCQEKEVSIFVEAQKKGRRFSTCGGSFLKAGGVFLAKCSKEPFVGDVMLVKLKLC